MDGFEENPTKIVINYNSTAVSRKKDKKMVVA